jgi:arylsulfatase A-like enzyme
MKHFLPFLACAVFASGFQSSDKTLMDSCAPGEQQPNILFLIADDWSYPHAGIYGDPVVRTPNFDFLAKNGALFQNAFCASPSCSPSRASILTSRYPHQLGEAGNLWSVISNSHPNWVSLLQEAGYHTGKSGKGWGPGDYEKGGYTDNPAGKDYPSFEAFLDERKESQPFYFWLGSSDPHRDYETNTGARSGMNASAVVLPEFLPDLDCIRNDMMDYYFEVERFDRECGSIVELLKQKNLLDNTLIVMTSDNGMPFPRAKANLYDYGTRMPLAIFWKDKVSPALNIRSFMNFVDFGPTFLEAAGVKIPEEFSGESLLPLVTGGKTTKKRDKVFLERERHANVRKGDLSYPSRGVRTEEYLYIRNFEPDRWPAGDPETHQSVGQYGDVDNSISKFLILNMKDKQLTRDYFELAFGKRPAEELYLLSKDPYNLHNLASEAAMQTILELLRGELARFMEITKDPRHTDPNTPYWDEALYTPDYQFNNFDLKRELSDYKMLKRDATNSFKTLPCDD